MDKLSERVARAEGASRELDAEIGRAMHDAGWHAGDCLRQFTASLDAAMTLVPDNHKWAVYGGGYASVEPWDGDERNDEVGFDCVKAATPALALCAAALKARGL